MNPYRPLVNLTGRVIFVDPYLSACARGILPAGGDQRLKKLRGLLGLDDATNDAQARLVYGTLRLVRPVLRSTFADVPPLPAADSVPPVFQLVGAKADPASRNVSITSSHRKVTLVFADAQAAVISGGDDAAVVGVRAANGFLAVDWPSWCRVDGLLHLTDQVWEVGCRVEIISPCQVVGIDSLVERLRAWPDLHSVLRDADLADLFNGAANPAYKLGYAAAALVLLTENS